MKANHDIWNGEIYEVIVPPGVWIYADRLSRLFKVQL